MLSVNDSTISKVAKNISHILKSLMQWFKNGFGSFSFTTIRKSRRWTMSYLPTRCSGGSFEASNACSDTFWGSHSTCGYPDAEMSKPSSWIEDGRSFARSRSQALFWDINHNKITEILVGDYVTQSPYPHRLSWGLYLPVGWRDE